MQRRIIPSILFCLCSVLWLLAACQSAEVASERSSVAQAIQNQTGGLSNSQPTANTQSTAASGPVEAADAISNTTEVAASTALSATTGQAQPESTEPIATEPAPADEQEAAPVNGILNPAVLDRPLSEIMPALFVTETVTDTAELQALSDTLNNSTPPRDPVPISSLWQAAPPVNPIESWHKTENYLILGTDRRPTWDIWRTDVIIVVGVDRVQRRAAVFSIPRDTYVPIPGHGWDRINTADIIGERSLNVEGGGPALVSAVISNTFGVPTQHWVRVDMDGFEELVDAVGGVTIHLDCPFYEPITDITTGGWTYLSLPAGDVTLDGVTAHWYARLRLRESDIGRTRRQRQLLWALREKMLNANLIVRLPQLWSALQGKFSTDLTLLDIVDLAQWGLPLNSSRIHTGGLTTREVQPWTTPGGGAVLRIVDIDLVQRTIDGVWSGALMANAVAPENGVCPAPPADAPIFPTPTPKP
ncbi:MAG: LCP family protein [Caldilineaceae bacterium]|nr:LCP family protein [Caldilineaceae bacterium]